MKKTIFALVLSMQMLSGCDGPNEKAGEEQDRAAAAVAGQPYQEGGPNERLGEARDRVVDAQADEARAQARIAKRQRDEIETSADVAADALENRASVIRANAHRNAAALN